MFRLLAVEPLPPPVAVPAGVFLGGILMFLLCFTFDRLWRATLGPILVRIGKVGFGGIRGHLQAHPFGFLVSFNDDMEKWLKAGEALGERYAVNAFGTILWFFYNLTFTTVKAVYDLNTAIDNVWANVTRSDGTAFNARTQARLDKLAARETAIEHRLGRLEQAKRAGGAAAGTLDHAKLQRGIDRLEREIGQVRARERALERTAGKAHAHTATDVAGVPRWVARRISKVEKRVVGIGAAALVLTALKRLGLGWLRCNNVGKAGKAVCGMNPRLLESLLFDAAALAVAFNLETFAEEMQSVTEEAASLINNWAT